MCALTAKLHRESAGSSRGIGPVFFCHQHRNNIGRLGSIYGIVASGTRKDGSTYVRVLYRLSGKWTSTSFEDRASVTKFQKPSKPSGFT